MTDEIHAEGSLTTALPMDEAADVFKEENFKYTAFISYRHIEPDQTIAAKIHSMIETFRVPREFYVNGKRPVFRVFRDREELSAADLSASIEDALRSSKFLIVICSRATPLSEWCLREVETFRKLHGDERIIPVLVEGEPAESFPPALLALTKKKVLDNGETVTVPHEILAAELRPEAVRARDFAGYEALRKGEPGRLAELRGEAVRLLRTEKFRIMAAILGCSYGDLKQRDKERRTRTALMIAPVLAVALLGFGIFMFQAWQRENAARRAAVQSNSAMLLNTARELIAEGDKLKALLVADQAMGVVTSDMEKYPALNAEHTTILNDAVYNASASLLTVLKTGNSITFFAVSPDGARLVAGYGNQQAAVFDARTGALLRLLEGHRAQVKIVSWSPDGRWFVTSAFDDRAIVWDAATYTPVHEIELQGSPIMTVFTLDGNVLATAGYNWNTYFFQFTRVGDWQEARPDLEIGSALRSVGLNRDASRMLVTYQVFGEGVSLEMLDLSSGKSLRTFEPAMMKNLDEELEAEPYYSARFSLDGKGIIAYNTRGVLKLDGESGEELFRYGDGLYLSDDTEAVSLTESSAGERLYFADGSNILALDGKSGRLLESYFVGGIIKTYAFHEGTKTLAALQDTGNVVLIRDGVLVESGLDYGSGIPDLIEFAPDGSKLYLSSRGNKEIKLVDLLVRNIETTIAGQIITVSADNKRILMYDGNEFFLWDNERNERSGETVISDGIERPTSLAGRVDFVLGPGGRKIANYYSEAIETADGSLTGEYKRVLQLIDMASDTTVEIPLEKALPYQAFSPDGKLLAALVYGQPIALFDAETGEARGTLPAELVEGFLNSVRFSEDSGYLILNYQEGSAAAVDLAAEQVVARLPGEILYGAVTGDGLELRGIFNNASFTWTEKTGAVYTRFDPACDAAMVSLTEDRNTYNPQADLVLMIRENAEKPVGYLVQFSTGHLLKTFVPSLTAYQAQGFISQDGQMVGIDEYYYQAPVDPEKDDFEDEHAAFMGTTLYRLYAYEALVREGKKLVTGRELTVEERGELGLE